MGKIADIPLSSTFANAAYINLQANGISVTNATNPDGIGDSLAIVNGCMQATIKNTDALTHNGKRSELAFTPSAREECFYVWDFMICSPWEISSYITFLQMHDSPDAAETTSGKYPQFILGLVNGCMIGRVPADGILPAGESLTPKEVFRVPYKLDRWYQMCLHANWQIDAGGMREIFIDRVPVFRQYGLPTHYDDVIGPYLKIGTYAQEGGTFSSLTTRHKNLRIWTGTNGYTDVMGGVPISPVQIIDG